MKISVLIAATAITLCLASCGGSNNIPSNLVLAGNLQNYLNTPTYVQGTEELAAFNAINAFRSSMGLGYWQQNVYMDLAAQHHMQYSILNPQITNPFQTDIEVAGNAGFTGTTPSARAIAAGYFFLQNTVSALNVPTASVGELFSTGSGATIVNDLVNTIYHRSGLMTQSTVDMGLARDTTGTITAANPTHWWINHGSLLTTQYAASNYLQNYPLNQQSNVPLSMTPEYPSVYSKIPNFNFATSTSSPLSLTASPQVKLTITSVSVTPAGSSTPLPGTIWSMDNDPNLLASSTSAPITSSTPPPPSTPTLSAYEVYWVGSAPFKPNTTYTVTFTGTTFLISYSLTNPVSQTWTFTTGSGT